MKELQKANLAGALDDPIVEFEDWERVLRETVPVALQAACREAGLKFRYWLREIGKPAMVEALMRHLAWKKSYLPAQSCDCAARPCGGIWRRGKGNGRRKPARLLVHGQWRMVKAGSTKLHPLTIN